MYESCVYIHSRIPYLQKKTPKGPLVTPTAGKVDNKFRMRNLSAFQDAIVTRDHQNDIRCLVSGQNISPTFTNLDCPENKGISRNLNYLFGVMSCEVAII